MNQRTALLVATALTVFVVVLTVGVVLQVFLKSNVEALALQAAAPTLKTEIAAEAPVPSGPTQAQFAEREAAYQQLIQQANQRLEQANKKEQELAKQLASQSQAASPRASQPPTYKVTPEQAATIALITVPGAVLSRPPELVDFKGTAAYEVTLDRGVVYVDANTGQVLYNSAAVIVVHESGGAKASGGASSANVNSGGGERNDDREGEGGDD